MSFGDYKNPGVTAVNTDDTPFIDSTTSEVVPAGATAVWDGDNWDVIISPATESATAPTNPIDNQIWVDSSVSPKVTKIWRDYIGNGSWLVIGVPEASRINPRGTFVLGDPYIVGDVVTHNDVTYYCEANTSVEPVALSLAWSVLVPASDSSPDIQVSLSNDNFVIPANYDAGYTVSESYATEVTVTRNGIPLVASSTNLPNTFICTIETAKNHLVTPGTLTKGLSSYTLAAPTAISLTETSYLIIKTVIRDKTGTGVAKTAYTRVNYTLIRTVTPSPNSSIPQFAIGTVESVLAAPEVTVTGTSLNPILNFKLTKGDNSTVPGPAPLVSVGTVSSGTTPSVIATETEPGKVKFDFVLAKGADSTVPGPAYPIHTIMADPPTIRGNSAGVLSSNSVTVDLIELTGYYGGGYIGTQAITWTIYIVTASESIPFQAGTGWKVVVPIYSAVKSVVINASFQVNGRQQVVHCIVPVMLDGKDGKDGTPLAYDIIGGSTSIEYDDLSGVNILEKMVVNITKTYDNITTSDGLNGYFAAYAMSSGNQFISTLPGSPFIGAVASIDITDLTSNLLVEYWLPILDTYVKVASRTFARVPTGRRGLRGEQGDPGQNATFALDATTTLAAGAAATVTNTGTETAVKLKFGIPRGNTGEAAKIEVRSVADGDIAAVTNAGTMYHALLDFVLPRGQNGTRTGVMTLFKWSLEKPTSKPAGASIYTWADATFTAPATLNGWSDVVPEAVGGLTLWACRLQVINKSDSTTTGVDWGNSVIVAAGSSGPNSYVWVRYADDASGLNMTAIPGDKLFIGLAFNKTTALSSNNASDYQWTQIRGIDGVSTTLYTIVPEDGGITKTAAGLLTPNTATFKLYKRVGNGALVPEDYFANWTISIDGGGETTTNLIVTTSAGVGGTTGSNCKIALTNVNSKITARAYRENARTTLLAEYSLPIVLQGPKGDTGLAAGIDEITVATSDAGSAASVTYGGTAAARTIAFTIPRGNIGFTQDIKIGTVGYGTTASANLEVVDSLNKKLNLILPKGDKGDAGTIDSVTVKAGAVNSLPAITLGGTASSRTIELTIPEGKIGKTPIITVGNITSSPTPRVIKTAASTDENVIFDFELAKGDKGDTGTITIRNVTTGAAGSSVTISNVGTPSSALLDISIPKGDIGVTPQVGVGTVSTGLAGSSAAVAIAASSTLSNPKFDFTIPKGDKGDIGPSLYILSDRQLVFYSIDGLTENLTGGPITLTAISSGLTGAISWSYTGLVSSPAASTSATYTITPANFGSSSCAQITCTIGSYSASVTIYRYEASSAAPHATVGADWNTNISNKPTTLKTINNDEGTLLNLFSYSNGLVKLNANFSSNANITAYDTSDRNLKEDIKWLADPLERLLEIPAVSFKWNEEYYDRYLSRTHPPQDIGVIAQDVQRVLPEAVKMREDGVLAVNYMKLIPLLIGAIAEQQKQIEELKDAILSKRC
jgi:hypothetical protein